MTFKTTMVHLELEPPNDGLFALTADLAGRFESALVTGITGCQPIQLLYDQTYVAGEIMTADREQIEAELKKVEQRFREAFKGKVKRLEWRSNVTCGPLADYLINPDRPVLLSH